MIAIILTIIFYFRKKQKNFSKKYQELTDKLVIINDLNKIQINLIKFDKKDGKKVILGKGAFATVYSGKYNRTNVAIKEITPDKFSDDLITEIVLLKNLDHANIIKSYGYSIDEDGNFFILTGKINFIIIRFNEKWLFI
jgi:predicted Ser/Thr protein kinase